MLRRALSVVPSCLLEFTKLSLVALSSLGIWLALAMSIIGIFYVGLIALFLFVAHVVFIAHIRGSAVKLSPRQFPELHARVVELAARAGLDEAPDTYLLQEGGALNALATKFLRSEMIVVYSDLLDACEDDPGARDMIIGHELCHIRAGHLRFLWLLLPGLIVPFLGAAYSRAREYTCDRFGTALSGDRGGALRGLAILAVGGRRAKRVDLDAFVDQRHDLDTGLMTLARWLTGYPTLAERVAALDPSLGSGPWGRRGVARAIGILTLALALPIAGLVVLVGVVLIPAIRQVAEVSQAESSTLEGPVALAGATEIDVPAAMVQLDEDVDRLSRLVRTFHSRNGFATEDIDVIYEMWTAEHPDQAHPLDPFDGLRYGYNTTEEGFVIWSVGPDGEAGSEDDVYRSFQLPVRN